MGAAWRDLAGRKSGFEKILKMVTEVRGMGMEGELVVYEQETDVQSAQHSVCCLLIRQSDSKRPA